MAVQDLQVIVCSKCRRRYRWRPQYAGRRVRCKHCGEVLPGPASMSAGVWSASSWPGAKAAGQAAPAWLNLMGEGQGAARSAAAASPSATAACPSCGAVPAGEVAFCGNCGTRLGRGPRAAAGGPGPAPGGPRRLRTAPAPRAGNQTVSQRHPRQAGKPISLSQVLAAPFHGDVPAQALLMVLGTFGWMILLVLALFFSIAFVVVLGRAVVLLMQLVALGVLVAFIGWTTKQYVATTEQHASGAMIADTDRTKLHCLGMFLLVSLIAWGPLLALLRAASWDLSSASPLELFAASVWGALYWPMGIAMAGAYGIANPVKVVEKVFRTFPAYIAVLAVLVPFVALSRAVGAMAALRLSGLLPGILGILSGSIVAMILVQYGLIGAFAMLGTLLRKYRPPEQPT